MNAHTCCTVCVSPVQPLQRCGRFVALSLESGTVGFRIKKKPQNVTAVVVLHIQIPNYWGTHLKQTGWCSNKYKYLSAPLRVSLCDTWKIRYRDARQIQLCHYHSDLLSQPALLKLLMRFWPGKNQGRKMAPGGMEPPPTFAASSETSHQINSHRLTSKFRAQPRLIGFLAPSIGTVVFLLLQAGFT